MAYPPIKGETRIVNVDLEKCLSEAEREQQLSNRMQRLDDEREQSTYTEQSRQQQYKEFGFQNGDEKENGRETIMCDSDDESSKNRMEKRRNRRELQFTIQGLRPGTRHSKVVARHYMSSNSMSASTSAFRWSSNPNLMDVFIPPRCTYGLLEVRVSMVIRHAWWILSLHPLHVDI